MKPQPESSPIDLGSSTATHQNNNSVNQSTLTNRNIRPDSKDSTQKGKRNVQLLEKARDPSSGPANHQNDNHDRKDGKRSSYGKTSDGKIFKIPETHDMISSLFDPRLPKSHLDVLTLMILLVQSIPILIFRRKNLQKFYLTSFLFWRLSYNLGLGWVLKRQSERKFLVRMVDSLGLFDRRTHPRLSNWLESQLESKMSSRTTQRSKRVVGSEEREGRGEDGDEEEEEEKGEGEGEGEEEVYKVNSTPLDYNVWLLFRQLVDIILLSDFLSYFLLSFCSLKLPSSNQPQSLLKALILWSIGSFLVGFNVWVKVNAHRIVHDFAWYWGDAFFLSIGDQLVFDGVFEMAPHPMYSIGYAGFYGSSLITGSKLVFFISLIAHILQFGFLIFFENPHIKRTYGPQSRPLTGQQNFATNPRSSRKTRPSLRLSSNGTSLLSPSSPIKAESISNSDRDSFSIPNNQNNNQTLTPNPVVNPTTVTFLSRQELEYRLFRKKGMIGLHNFDRFRAIDLSTVLLLSYNLLFLMIDNKFLSLIHAMAWRVWFSFGLGIRLINQSNHNSILLHFLTNYPVYLIDNNGGGDDGWNENRSSSKKEELVEDSFDNWRSIYNLSLMMTYVSFSVMAVKFYKIDENWDLFSELVRNTFGLCLIGIHVWMAKSTFEVLGKFGWFYGDFFIDDYRAELSYGGIYRFLNNPERLMGGAGLIGISLMCNDKIVIGMAFFSIFCHWWFLSKVESPHMKKVYGDMIRKEAGLTKVLKQSAKSLKKPPPQKKKMMMMMNNLESSRLLTSSRLNLETDSNSTSLANQNHNKDTKYDEVNNRKDGDDREDEEEVGGGEEEEEEVGEGESKSKGFEKRFKEVQGTFEFIYEEAVEALDEFLEKSAPRLSGVVRDTKVLLQSSGERLIMTRVANDLSSYDTSRYELKIEESNYHLPRDPESKRLRFHMGEPIRLRWSAPMNHSRLDWIGCYRRGSNRSGLLTEVVSQGRWCGLNDQDWDGDMFIGKKTQDEGLVGNSRRSASLERGGKIGIDDDNDDDLDAGFVEFKSGRLPWKEGLYEFRYHHDGKHNVMAITEPFEIYVERFGSDFSDIKEAEDEIRKLVGYGLGLESELIPRRLLKEIKSRDKDESSSSKGGEGQTIIENRLRGSRSSSSLLKDGMIEQGPIRDGGGEGLIGSKVEVDDKGGLDRKDSSKEVREDEGGLDEDRFTIMSLEEARRIKRLIEIGIGIELGIEILIEDAEIGKLTRRIIFVKSLLKPFSN